MKVKAVLGPYPPRFGGAERRAVGEWKKSRGIFIGTSHAPEQGRGRADLILIRKRRFPVDLKFLLWKIFLNRRRIGEISAHFATTFGFTAALAKKFWKIPYTVTCHGTDVFLNLKRWPHRWFTLYALRNADGIVAVSEALKNRVMEEGIPESRVKLSIAQVDRKRFRKTNVKKRDQIIFVGKVQRAKGVDLLIEAFGRVAKKFPRYDLIIVGDFAETGYYRKLLARLNDLGIRKRVKFFGNREDVPELLNDSKLFVLPSRTEGYGIALAEALCCGLPCIAAKTGGIPEVAKKYKGECILIEPNEVDLAIAMEGALLKLK